MSLTLASLLRVVRFFTSGVTAAVSNLVVLYIATELFSIWYLFSACMAFVVSFVVSFSLQKFWTFRDRQLQRAHTQAFFYFGVALVNLTVSISLLYFFVEFAGLHYLVGQILTMGLIACITFFIYRYLIFDVPEDENMSPLLPLSHLIVLIGAAVVGTLLPFILMYTALGQVPVVPVALYNDADYYYDRMHEITDGYPFLGNPYFFEHRSDPPPAFFIADWLGAIPLLLGMPLMQAIYFNILGWSLAFLLGAYVVLSLLCTSRLYALLGSVFAYFEIYTLLIRPVSMQVVFPFFLLFLVAYAWWLNEPRSTLRQVTFGGAAAVAAAMYTYTWQIIVVLFVVSICISALLGRRDMLRGLMIPSCLFLLLIAPFVLITVWQTSVPFYEETIVRIGLVRTHLPIFAGFVIPFIPLSVGILACLTRPRVRLVEWLRDPAIIFFSVTAISITGVMLSNIITGLDLELPQHVERFVIIWFALATSYLLPRVWSAFKERTNLIRAALVVGSAFVIVVHSHYVISHGIPQLFNDYDVVQARALQGVTVPLLWLDAHATSSAVVWADPDGMVNKYIAMQTKHYPLFHMGGILHILSDTEAADRYIVAHYFGLTRAQLVRDHHRYAGVGNAIHPYKTHNRTVRMCEWLHLPWFGYSCGIITDHETFVGPAYFDALFMQYQDMIPQIEHKLEEYNVSYAITDSQTDTWAFNPALFPYAVKIYDDGRFQIFEFRR